MDNSRWEDENDDDDGHSLALLQLDPCGERWGVDGAADGRRFSEANSRTRWMHRRKDAMTSEEEPEDFLLHEK